MYIVKRLNDDFLRPSKEADYERILKTACENGYEFHTMLSFEDLVREGKIEGKRYLILRRAINTADSKFIRKM